MFGVVGLVAQREVRERIRGRVFQVGTGIILLVVIAAIVIPVLTRSKSEPERVGVVGTLSAPLTHRGDGECGRDRHDDDVRS